MKRIKKGFTLAEVLITLAIIGIVAALTVPTLMTDSRYQLVSSRIAKFVSVTEDAALAQAAMNGTIEVSNDKNDLDDIVLYKSRSGNAPYYTYQLKDGTELTVGALGGDNVIDPNIADDAKYGTGATLLTFSHKVSGISDVTPSLRFIMTNKGYIFPDNSDNCSKTLFDTGNSTKNPWKLTKTIAKDQCKKANS